MVYKKYSAMKFSRKGRRVGARYTPRKRPKDAGRFEVEDAAREIKGSASGPNLSVPASSAESDSFAGTRKSTYEDGYPYYSADFDDTLQEAQTDFMRPRLGKSNHVDIIDEFMGFKRVLGGFEYGPERLGWLINMHSVRLERSSKT